MHNMFYNQCNLLHGRGICYNCQEKLPQNVLNKTQLFELSSFFTDKLEQESKLLSSSRPSSSNTSQMHSLKKLIKTKGPFDYVVDGLNVAYGGNSKFNFDKVLVLYIPYGGKIWWGET